MPVSASTAEYINRRPNVDRDPCVPQSRNLELPRRVRAKADLEPVLWNPDDWEVSTQSASTFPRYRKRLRLPEILPHPERFPRRILLKALERPSQLPSKCAVNHLNMLEVARFRVDMCSLEAERERPRMRRDCRITRREE